MSTQPKKRSWIVRVWESDKFLNKVSLLVAVVYGTWGIMLTIQANRTSVDVGHFNQLLTKTDSLIDKQSKIANGELDLVTLSHDQIDSLVVLNKTLLSQVDILSHLYSLNESQQKNALRNNEVAQIGYMNKLYTSSYRINEYVFWDFTNSLRSYDKESLIECSKKLDSLKNMFLSEMSNPYLNEHTYLDNIWRSAYGKITNFNHQINDQLYQLGDVIHHVDPGNTYDEIATIDRVALEQNFIECSQTMSGALNSVMTVIRTERIKKGLDDKNSNPIIKKSK